MNGQPPPPEIHSSDDQTKTKISKWDTDRVDGSTVHGVETELLVMQKMLGKPHGRAGNGFKAIGIIGVRGIGKSTICRAFLQNPQVKSEYIPRIWVSLSRNFTEDRDPKIALLKRILISLGTNPNTNFSGDGQTLAGLLYAVRLQLRGKRYLIVLDDAQEFGTEEGQNWYSDLNCWKTFGENLRDGFPRGNEGAVIVTSRSEKAAKFMVGEENLLCLVPQKNPESFWEIFWQEVVRDGDDDSSYTPPNLEEMKVELLKKCGGLPLAAKMMGRIKFNQNQ